MRQRLQDSRTDILLLAVAVAWGSTYLVAKNLVTPATVLSLLAVRMLLAAALLAALAVARRRRWTSGELTIGALLGVLLAAVFACETFGLAHTSSTHAGVLISVTSVFTPLLESVVSRHPLPARFFFAAGIAVVGVALLSEGGAFRPPNVGDLLILLAAAIRAVHVTAVNKLTATRDTDSMHLTVAQLTTCAVVFASTSALTGESLRRYVVNLDSDRWMLVMYLVVICTVFAFLVQTWAVRRTSASRVSLLLGTEPVWAAIIGLAIARDRIGVGGWAGIVLVLVSATWGRSIEQRHRQRPHAGRRDPSVTAAGAEL